MLKIKPSLRINRRYLLLRGKKEDVEKAILDYIGILGWANASPEFIKHEYKIILAVDRKEIDKVKAAFAMTADKIEVLRVSGTIKGVTK